MRLTPRIVVWFVLLPSAMTAQAQSRGGHSHGGTRSHHGFLSGSGTSPVTINPSSGSPLPPRYLPVPIVYGGPIVIGWGGWVPYAAPILPAAYFASPPPSTGFFEPGPPVAEIPPALLATPSPPATAPRPRTRNSARSKELMELGDRLFRAGNLIHAVQRYEQAVRADEDLAAPRVRLSQVALVRGKYQEAANLLREAQAAEPGWLATAGDVRAIYPEPNDFARHVATLEAHLQTHPEDRDAWLVLGALWYLSGRTEQAADVFVRLTDRREDPTLRAFLRATKSEPDGDDE